LTLAQEQTLLARVTWRLVPLLFVCYIIAYIDRINVGFAKLHLRDALGVDAAVYGSVDGLGAGLFFIGYFLFEIPSNLILQRVGARIWIARIMIVWGLVSMSMMLITGVTSFYVMRFLLGAAEAGFFPGVIFYLTSWFPAAIRARTIAMFATGGVVAGVVGSPLSGAILGLDGVAGLAGWQWLFLLEAIPALLMGIVVLLVLPDRPRQARWLSDAEKGWMEIPPDGRIASAQDRASNEQTGEYSIRGRGWRRNTLNAHGREVIMIMAEYRRRRTILTGAWSRYFLVSVPVPISPEPAQ
jgi:ACS family tartrate transporter-like MFS transporter